MASIERTAYPRFKRVVSTRELEASFTPTLDEIAWAQSLTKSPAHLLGLVLALKCFQRLGRFPPNDEVPDSVTEHVRTTLGLAGEVNATATPARTVRQHRSLVRQHLGVVSDPRHARKVAEAAVHSATETKDNPADLINVALEELVRGRYEIPGYSTLDDMAARIRTEINGAYFAGIARRMTEAEAYGPVAVLGAECQGTGPGTACSYQTRVPRSTLSGPSLVGKGFKGWSLEAVETILRRLNAPAEPPYRTAKAVQAFVSMGS